MKKILIVSFSLLFSCCYGQDIIAHNLLGFLTTEDGQNISFKLMINNIESGEFSGYSATDYEGENYTKSLIKGEIDLSKNTFSFRELNNTETHSTANDSLFCYITVSNLKIKQIDKKSLVKGKFKGSFPSGKPCVNGSILLVNENSLIDSLKNKNKPSRTYINPSNNTVTTDLTLTANEKLPINNWGDNLTIEIWDGNLPDDDEIAVYVNNKLIREKVVLANKKTFINLPDTENNFDLKIVALNEGKFGINTLNFRITGVEKEKEYVAKLKTRESFVVSFNKE